MQQSDVSFELVVVIVRRPKTRGAGEAYRRVHDGIKRADAVQQGLGIHIDFEGRPDLTVCLHRPVELTGIVIVSAHHGLDFACRIVNNDHRSLNQWRLVQGCMDGIALHVFNFEQVHVPRAEDGAGVFLLRPKKVGWPHLPRGVAESHYSVEWIHIHHDPVNQLAWFQRVSPVLVFVGLQGRLPAVWKFYGVFQDISFRPSPAAALVIHAQAPAQRLLRFALHFDVQRCIDTKPFLLDRLQAILPLKELPDILDKVRCNAFVPTANMQFQWRLDGGFVLGLADLVILQHGAQDFIAAVDGVVRMKDRPVERAAGHSGKQGSLRKRQLIQVFPKIKLCCRRKAIVSVTHRDLIGVQGENLGLGEPALDLDGQQGFLDFPAEALFRGQEEHAGQLLRQGAGALSFAPLKNVGDCSAHDSEDVNSPVALEIAVFY